MSSAAKSLIAGIVFIVVVGIGGLVYRNALEHPSQPVACPLDAKVCPDGTSLARTGPSCTFPTCPPPNVSLAEVGIAYAVPAGFAEAPLPDDASVTAYDSIATSSASSTQTASIIIRRYEIAASSSALATIRDTAIGGASGAPVSATAFSSAVLGTHRFTVVAIERFEGTIDTAYYLSRERDVLRFDAIDRSVLNWTDPALDVAALPTQKALRGMLSTLAGQ